MVYPEYVYEDGSFKIEGDITIYDWDPLVCYECLCIRKGSFSTTLLNIENSDDYKSWTYTTENGEEVLLCKSEYKALIIKETDDSYVTVNIFNGVSFENEDGSIEYMTEETLEKITELFDFSVL